MAHMIELHKVSKYYANKGNISTGFSKVDLNLDMGEFIVITGESGSGKSTLLNVISGLDSYEEGEMFVGGEDTSAFKTEDYERYRKNYIGNIFQDFNLVNSYTVFQNVELAMLMCGMKRSECKDRVKDLIEQVGLKEYVNTKASKLSGGQKQRVAIARALAKDAPIIVADEPTGNLDSESAAKVMETLYKISEQKLVVIVTHNYEQAEPYVTRKITVHDGRVIEDKVISKRVKPAIMSSNQESNENREIESREEELKQEELKNEESEKTLEEKYESVPLGRRSARNLAREEEQSKEKAKRGRGSSVAKTSSETKFKEMGALNELRLGIRNTFNLPTKFILLFIVYFFLSSAVLSQYAATKNSLHEQDVAEITNDFFNNTRAERIVVKKQDNTPFTDEDYKKLEKVKNIGYLAKEDIALDQTVSLQNDYFFEAGHLYPGKSLEGRKLTYGTMPKQDNDIVVVINARFFDKDYVKTAAENIIGKEVEVNDDGTGETVPVGKVRVTGFYVYKSDDPDSLGATNRDPQFYCSDALAYKFMTSKTAEKSELEASYNGQKVKSQNANNTIKVSDKVPQGKAFIFEGQNQNFKDSKWEKQPLSLSVSNIYYSSSVSLKTERSLTKKNCKTYLGISPDDYETYANCIFINPSDYSTLLDHGNYQISVFSKSDLEAESVAKEIEKAGSYHVLSMSEMTKHIPKGIEKTVKTLYIVILAIEMIILFFIAYTVIRLVMKSRNSYYSTLRILGANRKNTDNILRIELVIMMAIAITVDFVLIKLMKMGKIDLGIFKNAINFLELRDYIILVIALLLTSLLIARRYSRGLFKKSAMNIYREEA